MFQVKLNFFNIIFIKCKIINDNTSINNQISKYSFEEFLIYYMILIHINYLKYYVESFQELFLFMIKLQNFTIFHQIYLVVIFLIYR